MKLEHLELFLTVADCKSMTTAANQLYLAPQNVSKIIAGIESEINTPLFVRTRQGVYLTEAGEKMYLTAKEISSLWANFSSEVSVSNEASDSIKGTLSIISSPSLLHMISTFSQKFQKQYPDIRIILHEQSTLFLSGETIGSGKYNIMASTYEKSFLDEKNANKTHAENIYIIKEEPVRLFFNKSNPYIKNVSTISSKLLNTIPMVAHCASDTDNTIFSDVLKKRNINPNYVFSTNNLGLCHDYILNDNVAFLSTLTMFNQTFSPLRLTEITSLPLQDKITISHVLFFRSDQMTRQMELFLDFFDNEFDLIKL